MIDPLGHFTRVIVTYRWWVIIAAALTSLTLGAGLASLHVEVNPDQQLPQQHKYIQTLNRVHNLFGDKNLVIIGLVPADGEVFSQAFLTKVRSVTQRIAQLPGIEPQLTYSLGSSNTKIIEGGRDRLSVR